MSLSAPNKSGPRLGRGLAALMGDTAIGGGGGAGSVRTLPVEMLEPGPFQPRVAMDPEALAELAASIKQQGLLQPILVRAHPGEPGRYQIIGGERRWRASQQAGLHEILVYVRDLSDADAMAAALVENLQRQDLNPLEEAEGFRRLTEDFGLTADVLAEAVGKSRSHVANSMRLLNLPASVAAEVRGGRLSAGHARAMLGHHDPALLLPAVLAKHLTVRQVEEMVRMAKLPGAARGRDQEVRQSPEIAALERELSEHLGLKVEIGFAGGAGGHVRIHYKTLDQLDGVLMLLKRD